MVKFKEKQHNSFLSIWLYNILITQYINAWQATVQQTFQNRNHDMKKCSKGTQSLLGVAIIGNIWALI